MSKSTVLLEDNTILQGKSFGATVDVSGEVVFNTGMVGYLEALTDPSYRGQILVLTYPLIGNYGVTASKSKVKTPCHADMAWQKLKLQGKSKILFNSSFESEKIQIAGLVVSEYCSDYSHPSAKQSLADWLKSEGVPAVEGVDTRALTEKLREKGTMLGVINSKFHVMPTWHGKIQNFDDPNKRNLAAEVSCQKPIIYEPLQTTNYKLQTNILLYDCGVKLSIIRSLLKRGCRVIRVPWDYEIKKCNSMSCRHGMAKFKIDGVIISNGPGDPVKCDKTIKQIKKILEIRNSMSCRHGMVKLEIPILGICLGNQILALAAGAKTYKLKYGHRGQNQPVVMSNLKRAFITSQNHGYAVDEKTLQDNWQVWFKNLNDGTVEGIRHCEQPWMAVQFHPEASPGPTDTEWIFDLFLQHIK